MNEKALWDYLQKLDDEELEDELLKQGFSPSEIEDMDRRTNAVIQLCKDKIKLQQRIDSLVAEFFGRPRKSVAQMQALCHEESLAACWHEKPREDGTMLALIHSEVSEALEGIRKDKMDEHLPHRRSAEVELADAVIRIFDFAGLKGYDIESAMLEKMEYNRNRLDHKREERAKEGGKKF